MQDKDWMRLALELAAKAGEAGDIPVGAVIVKDGELIGQGYNHKTQRNDPTSHAEMEAIRDACQKLQNWRLEDCVLYTTMEPCPMCAGAIVMARIKRVVIGAWDSKTGSCGSLLNIVQFAPLNHQVEVLGGVLEEESKALVQDFFQRMRIER